VRQYHGWTKQTTVRNLNRSRDICLAAALANFRRVISGARVDAYSRRASGPQADALLLLAGFGGEEDL